MTSNDEAGMLKALADPTRLRLAVLLAHQELCVCEIQALFGLPQSTVSRHMTNLKLSGVARDRREGRWVHYDLNGDHPVVARLQPFFELLSQGQPYQDDLARCWEMVAQGRCNVPSSPIQIK